MWFFPAHRKPTNDAEWATREDREDEEGHAVAQPPVADRMDAAGAGASGANRQQVGLESGERC